MSENQNSNNYMEKIDTQNNPLDQDYDFTNEE